MVTCAGCFASTVRNTFCSLDAIDPGKPHTADNVQWVCVRINLGSALVCCCDTLLRLRLCTCSLATAHPRSTGKAALYDGDFRAWARDCLRFAGELVTLADTSVSAARENAVSLTNDDD